jgi:hypothetical protein
MPSKDRAEPSAFGGSRSIAGARLGIKGALVLILAAGSFGCGEDSGAPQCIFNETRQCTDGMGSGVQVCSAERAWGACALGEQGNAGSSPSGGQQPPDDSDSTPAEPEPPSCFEGGDIRGIGCGTGQVQCCAGSVCVNIGASSGCAATCSAGADCASGCCIPLTDASASVCTAASECTPVDPEAQTPTTPPTFAESYELTRVDRIARNHYRARSGTTELVIETRLCLALTLLDDGLLARRDSLEEFKLYIDNTSGDVCDVADIYVAAPSLGTYDLTSIEHLDTDVYRADSGGVGMVIETQLCLALPVYDRGILVWDVLGSQLLIENFSGDVCDVVAVYGN